VVKRAVLWFRRDLRLRDNDALLAAVADAEVVALFVVDPRFTTSGAPRRAFMTDALSALSHAVGGALIFRYGDPVDVVPAFAAEVGASSVVVAGDFGPYGHRRDLEVARRLESDGRALRSVGSPYVLAPGSVRKDDGTPYAVFTPFFKRWQSLLAPTTRYRSVEVDWFQAPGVPRNGPPPRPAVDHEVPDAREASAHRIIEEFEASGGFDRYHERRDLPALSGTTQLSPYLRWGIIHPNALLDRLGSSDAHSTFLSELCWRDFYADVLATYPGSAWTNLRPGLNAMATDTDERARLRFQAWRTGTTGYPIVDAGMRQLLGTGWMHNRVRMITASFLVKDLHLPWQWGARHFMQHLVDGDLASNNHGWQWVAGTGTDAAPYFRVFNPVLQSERFDPDGHYIRRWVPELRDCGDREIHAPWRSKRGVPLGSLPPIVDHATERDEALRRYALVTAATRAGPRPQH
jgi:deoxyribodipyrimidine photo-lyase